MNKRAGATGRRAAALVALLLGLIGAIPVLGQDGAGSFTPTFGNLYATDPAKQAEEQKDPGRPHYETLRGTNSRVGYNLAYMSIVPGSESVVVGGEMLRRGRDYYLDYPSGSLYFAEAVPDGQTISITYRHTAGTRGPRSNLGTPLMPFRFGDAGNLGVSFNYVVGDKFAGGPLYDSQVFGLNSGLRFGGTKLDSLYYLSVPQEDKARDFEQRSNAAKPKTDKFFLQNLETALGAWRLTGGLQDVGMQFMGFSALRQQKVLDEGRLAQLERERGIRRTSYGLTYGGEKSLLGFGYNTSFVQDAGGQISRQSYGFANKHINWTGSRREVDAGFVRFGDLAEAERGQLQKERGLWRQDDKLTLSYNGFAANLESIAAGDATNSSTARRQTLQITTANLSIASTLQDVDAAFGRQMDLSHPMSKFMLDTRGQRIADYGIRWTPAKGLTANYYDLSILNRNINDDLHRVARGFTYAPTPKWALGYNSDRTRVAHTGQPDRVTGSESFSFSHNFLLGMNLAASLENVYLENMGTPRNEREKRTLKFSGLPFGFVSKRLQMTGDYYKIENEWNKTDSKGIYNLSTQLMKTMTLKLNRQDVVNTDAGNVKTDTGNLVWQLSPKMSLTVDALEQHHQIAGVTDGLAFKLAMPLTKTINFEASSGRTTVDPIGAAPDYDIETQSYILNGLLGGRYKLGVGYTMVTTSGNISSLVKTGRFEAPMMCGALILSYAGSTNATDRTAGSRTYSFVSNRDPKQRLHYNITYRTKDYGDGKSVPVRLYGLDYRLGKRGVLAATYQRNNERPDGKMDYLWGQTLKMNYDVGGGIMFGADYSYGKNWMNGQQVMRRTVSFAGKLRGNDLLQSSVTWEYNNPGTRTLLTYRLSYNYALNANRFIALSAEMAMVDDHNAATRDRPIYAGRLDYRFPISLQ